ncbi:sensor histidine kinase [Enterococcus sp. LJL51]|uniref:sensor histidine kinase n=1 Tax=Enterococcus sp. LJL51 TaxID=3416656 RepID=UPI003CF7805A
MKGLRRFLIFLFIGLTIPMIILYTIVDTVFIYYTNTYHERPSLMLAGYGGVIVIKVVFFLLFLFVFIRLISKKIQEENVRYSKEKMTLFANIAHDLKTPSTSVMGFAQALAEGEVAEPERQKELLKTIYEKSKQSNELLELMFQYTKLESTDYPFIFEKLDLQRLLKESVASLYNQFEERQIALVLDFPEEEVWLEADRTELTRALNNLLVNAYTHNPVGSKVLVQLTVKNDLVEVVIADTGERLSKETVEEIFLPFIQKDSARQKGSGLGLAITKTIIERHGGTISVVHTVPEYTKGFMIQLSKSN